MATALSADLTNFVGFARPGNKGHGVAFVDIDDDGALDIFAQLGGHYPGDHTYNAFYHNLKAGRESLAGSRTAGSEEQSHGDRRADHGEAPAACWSIAR